MSPARDGLLLAVLLAASGAQAAVPWRLARIEPERRRPWAAALLPLLAAGALAAFAYADLHPDAAVVQELYPLGASRLSRLLAVLAAAVALSDLLLAAGWRRIEPAAWRLAAGFGFALLLAASWAGERMRIGQGPESALAAFTALVLLRLLVALAAAETLTLGRPLLAPFAGAGLPLYHLLLPAALARALASHGALLTLGAAALLLLAARWLPPSLRRPALAAGTLLAVLYLAQAAGLSQGIGVPPEPMPDLPVLR